MVVMILEKVPRGVRGDLTRWLLELSTGVFVGHVSARVREIIWTKTCAKLAGGSAILLYSSNNEQGFEVSFWGKPDRVPEMHEGLILIRESIPANKQKWVEKVLSRPDSVA